MRVAELRLQSHQTVLQDAPRIIEATELAEAFASIAGENRSERMISAQACAYLRIQCLEFLQRLLQPPPLHQEHPEGVARREEAAAMRMEANSAKIFESSPTLMKLKELEVLEKVAEKANLTVVLGDGGLSERVMKLV